MNIEKYTQKSRAALQDAQRLAAENGNYAVEPVHLFLALLGDKEGLTSELLSSVGADAKTIFADAAVDTACGESFGGTDAALNMFQHREPLKLQARWWDPRRAEYSYFGWRHRRHPCPSYQSGR